MEEITYNHYKLYIQNIYSRPCESLDKKTSSLSELALDSSILIKHEYQEDKQTKSYSIS